MVYEQKPAGLDLPRPPALALETLSPTAWHPKPANQNSKPAEPPHSDTHFSVKQILMGHIPLKAGLRVLGLSPSCCRSGSARGEASGRRGDQCCGAFGQERARPF